MFTRRSEVQVRCFQSGSLARGVYPSLSAPLQTRCEPDPADVDAICQGLTVRQRDVLAVLLQGKSNKAICRILNLAEPTVKNHVTAILKALKVTNRTEAVIKVTETAVALLSFASTISRHQAFGRTPEL